MKIFFQVTWTIKKSLINSMSRIKETWIYHHKLRFTQQDGAAPADFSALFFRTNSFGFDGNSFGGETNYKLGKWV